MTMPRYCPLCGHELERRRVGQVDRRGLPEARVWLSLLSKIIRRPRSFAGSPADGVAW